MTKNRTPTPVYLDPGMHSGLEVKGLTYLFREDWDIAKLLENELDAINFRRQNLTSTDVRF